MAKLIGSNILRICKIKTEKINKPIMKDVFLGKIKEDIRKMEEAISKRKKKMIRTLEGEMVKKMKIKRKSKIKRNAVFNIQPLLAILLSID